MSVTFPSDPPTDPVADPAAPEAAVRVRLVLVAVAVTLFVASLGQTIVSTAIPTIVADLGGLDHITWVITAYLLASTVGAPIYGKLGDLFGRKIVMQSGILVFLTGSVIAGLAGNMGMMVMGRAVQGLGGGGLIVVAMAVVADVLPARERGRAQGLLGGVFGVSTVIGPLVGGFLVEHLSWHWIFFVNIPVGLAALIVLGIVLETPPTRVRHRIDYAGAGLLTGFLTAAVLISNMGGTALSWGSPGMLALIGGAAAALIGFIAVERCAAEPILPMPLFVNNTFVVVNAVGFLVGMAMFGTITFMPLFLQVVKGGVSPTASGLFLLPMMAGLLGASIGAGQAMAHTGRYKVMPVFSTALLAAGMLLLSTLTPDTPLWLIAVYMLIVGLGIGPVMSIGVAAIQNAVPMRMLGVGTASANMFRLIGGSLGTAAFGAIFSVGLARHLDGLLPAGAGLRAISPAVVAALPDADRLAVMQAFALALHPIYLVAAALALVAAALSMLLRELPLGEAL